jgi:carbonic anhydrase
VRSILGIILLVSLSILPAVSSGEDTPVKKVLSEEQQDSLSPDDVIRLLREGNDRFVNSELTRRDHSALIRDAVDGQYPKAMVLSCVDSRVPVEDVFDLGIGDIFVARVAGNFSNTDILGSMEFATRVSGSKAIVVLGHEHCGAVKAAIDDARLGNITSMLRNIKPAVEAHADYTGEKTSDNPEFVHLVAEENVRRTIEEIRRNSPVIREQEDEGEIIIVGALYDMDSGRVHFLD